MIHSVFRYNTLNFLSSSRIRYDWTISLENSFWIPYLVFDFIIFVANWLRILYLLRECTLSSHFFRECTLNSISSSRINYQFTVFFAISLWIPFEFNSLWIYYLFRGSTFNSLLIQFAMNWPSISRIHFKFPLNSIRYEFTIYFANSLWIHFLFREFTFNSLWIRFALNSPSISRIHFEFPIFSANSLRIQFFAN